MKISVLGSNCPSCKKLHEVVEKVVKDEAISAEVEYSTDVNRIIELGLMSAPVLVVDGKPVDFKSMSEKDIKEALQNKSNKKSDDTNCCCGGC